MKNYVRVARAFNNIQLGVDQNNHAMVDYHDDLLKKMETESGYSFKSSRRISIWISQGENRIISMTPDFEDGFTIRGQNPVFAEEVTNWLNKEEV